MTPWKYIGCWFDLKGKTSVQTTTTTTTYGIHYNEVYFYQPFPVLSHFCTHSPLLGAAFLTFWMLNLWLSSRTQKRGTANIQHATQRKEEYLTEQWWRTHQTWPLGIRSYGRTIWASTGESSSGYIHWAYSCPWECHPGRVWRDPNQSKSDLNNWTHRTSGRKAGWGIICSRKIDEVPTDLIMD